MEHIVIADDHPLFRAALVSAVRRAAPDAVVEEQASLAGARQVLADAGADLLLLDLKLPDAEGFGGLAAVRSEHPAVPVVVVSGSEDAATVRRVMAMGAGGFIPKSATLETMVAAISAVREGDSWAPDVPPDEEAEDLDRRIASLTPSQMKILMGLRQGRLNKQIAYDLGVTEATIKAHLTTVFRKLGVQNRTQAVILAQSVDI